MIFWTHCSKPTWPEKIQTQKSRRVDLQTDRQTDRVLKELLLRVLKRTVCYVCNVCVMWCNMVVWVLWVCNVWLDIECKGKSGGGKAKLKSGLNVSHIFTNIFYVDQQQHPPYT